MLRLALIGCGRWGKNYIKAVDDSGLGTVTQLLTSKSVEIQRITNSSYLERSFREDDRYFYKIVKSEIFDNIDAAIVATNPPLTEKYTIALLDRGISVMAEKPFTFNVSSLSRIQSTLDKSNGQLVFLINHQHLFSRAIDWISSFIDEQRVRSFQSEAGGDGPFREYSPLWDYGPHDLSLLGYLSESEFTLARYFSENIGAGTNQRIDLGAGGDLSARIHVWNNGQIKTHRFSIETDSHKIIFDDFSPKGRIWFNGNYPTLEYLPPLTLAVQAFLKKVSTKQCLIDRRFGTSIAVKYTRLLASIEGE